MLDRYPPSPLKAETMRRLRGADRGADAQRPLRFVVYDVVYAFQRLEARRLGLRPDRHPAQYAEFRHDFIASLAMWVPGRDPFIDGMREALAKAAKHDDPELNALLQDLTDAEGRRNSLEQSRRASSPRKAKAIDEYIGSVFAKNPAITLDELWEQIGRDEFGEVIESVEHDRVFVRGVVEPYTRGAIRNRFYKIRNSLRQSH